MIAFRHKRTIPACAGSTNQPAATADRAPDHPRVRGEHLAVILCDVDQGDHPRVRGEHNGRQGRLTACKDHPRVRGEHSRPWDSNVTARTIPACAGST